MPTKFDDPTAFTMTLQLWRTHPHSAWMLVCTVWYHEAALETLTAPFKRAADAIVKALAWYQGRYEFWHGSDMPEGFKVEGTEYNQLPLFRRSLFTDEP